MGRKRILYIGEAQTHREYLKGTIPSHWFYGAVEMEKGGNEVIWCQEIRAMTHDLRLVVSHKHDITFIPNLNFQVHFLLLVLATLGLYRKPIYAYLHREPPVKKGWKKYLYKFLLKGLKHLFFLSEKSMENTVRTGFLSKDRCSVPGWGADMSYYENLPVSDEGYFISTGKENRDFNILLEAFQRTGEHLKIYTVADNYDSHYSYLQKVCEDIPNIEVKIINNTASNYSDLVKEMANAKSIVCSLRQDRLQYCVGLSTITDAEALRKPLIITANPFHGSRPKEDCFYQVDTVEEWVESINEISNSQKTYLEAKFTMESAYKHMRRIMDL